MMSTKLLYPLNLLKCTYKSTNHFSTNFLHIEAKYTHYLTSFLVEMLLKFSKMHTLFSMTIFPIVYEITVMHILTYLSPWICYIIHLFKFSRCTRTALYKSLLFAYTNFSKQFLVIYFC